MIIKVFFIEEGFKNSVPGTQYSKYITELSSSSCNVKTYSKITTEVKNIYIYPLLLWNRLYSHSKQVLNFDLSMSKHINIHFPPSLLKCHLLYLNLSQALSSFVNIWKAAKCMGCIKAFVELMNFEKLKAIEELRV